MDEVKILYSDKSDQKPRPTAVFVSHFQYDAHEMMNCMHDASLPRHQAKKKKKHFREHIQMPKLRYFKHFVFYHFPSKEQKMKD